MLDGAGIAPARIGRVGPRLLPAILRLPDFLFALVARSMLRIDPEARSSMWEDLQAGRRTEVDYLNGAVLRLAQTQGRDAPLSRRVVQLMREAEAGRLGALPGPQLLAILHET